MNDWLAKKGFLDFKTRSLLHCMSLCCLCRCVLQWHSIREQRGTHKEKARKGEGKRRERLCRKKNGVLSYMDLQKDEECHLFLRSYFIFDVATKRIPLKGCFYVPDVLLPGNLHLQKHSCTTIPLGLLLAIMQQTIFSVRKVEKNLDKLRFYWANMRKKAARPAIPKRGSNHSPFFLLFTYCSSSSRSVAILQNGRSFMYWMICN